jgi:hypothetical protein
MRHANIDKAMGRISRFSTFSFFFAAAQAGSER